MEQKDAATNPVSRRPVIEYKGEKYELAFRMTPGPQEWAWKSSVDTLNYGGARGGGKSHWLLAEAYKRVMHAGWRAGHPRWPLRCDIIRKPIP